MYEGGRGDCKVPFPLHQFLSKFYTLPTYPTTTPTHQPYTTENDWMQNSG